MANFDKLLQPEPYRWPTRRDRAFRRPKAAADGAPIAQDTLERTVAIMGGFMQAGDNLAQRALDDPIARLELIYPITYCYRHAIETGLKWLVAQYGRPVGVSIEDINQTHDLLELWRAYIRIVEACGEDPSKEETATVGKIVKEFHDRDKGSFAFRYATDSKGAHVTLPDADIDLENLRDVMQAVANYMTGADGYLDHLTSAGPC